MIEAYLNIIIDTQATPPAVVGIKIHSEAASSLTVDGRRYRYAEIYRTKAASYHEAAAHLRRMLEPGESFGMFHPWLLGLVKTQGFEP